MACQTETIEAVVIRWFIKYWVNAGWLVSLGHYMNLTPQLLAILAQIWFATQFALNRPSPTVYGRLALFKTTNI